MTRAPVPVPFPAPAPPSLRRGLGHVIAAAVAGAVLWWLPLATAPLTDPGATASWWDQVGTPAAAAALARLLGLGLCAGLGLAGAVASVVATVRAAWLSVLWVRWAPVRVQRRFAAAVVTVSLAAAAPVRAADIAPPPVIVDLGPAEAAVADALDAGGTVVRDLGPAVADPGGAPAPATGPTADPDGRWVVEAGDHLWSVAAETLHDRGFAPTEAEVARYWRRVIEANRDIVGADPDLIHPGQVLHLPE